MRFYIDADYGTSLHGWVGPDNPSVIPRVRVVIPGRDDVEIQATEIRADIKEAGLHNTGQVGFTLYDGQIDDLPNLTDLLIVDVDSGLPIYARNDEVRFLQKHLAYIDLSIMPSHRLHAKLNASFGVSYNFVEQHPYDTMTSLIYAQYMKSVILIGRPYLARYLPLFKDQNFFVSVFMKHPLVELAERLMFIQALLRSKSAHLLPTFTVGLEPLIDFCTTIDLTDKTTFKKAFRGASDEVKGAMSNPYVKSLGGQAGEQPDSRNLSLALDNLSTVQVVGTFDHRGHFGQVFNALIEDDLIDSSLLSISTHVSALSQHFSEIPAITDLLDYDLALYQSVEDALTATTSH